jgi:hypothetical protein
MRLSMPLSRSRALLVLASVLPGLAGLTDDACAKNGRRSGGQGSDSGNGGDEVPLYRSDLGGLGVRLILPTARKGAPPAAG